MFFCCTPCTLLLIESHSETLAYPLAPTLTVLHGSHYFQIAYGFALGQHIDLLDNDWGYLFRTIRRFGINRFDDFAMIYRVEREEDLKT